MTRVRERGEPLVDLRKTCPGVIIALDPARMKREKTAYLRKTVATMLKKVQRTLPKSMTFIIRDAWRPQHVQERIFREFVQRFSRMHPAWSRARVIREVQKYVAPARGKYASGHMTGGAVDLRLWKNGRRVPMRSRKLTYQENAQSLQPKLPKYLQRNRQIMFDALTSAGLSNTPNEFWHWSYGDPQWAKRTKRKTALYNVVNHRPGSVIVS